MTIEVLDFGFCEKLRAGVPPVEQTFQDGFWIANEISNQLLAISSLTIIVQIGIKSYETSNS